MVARKTARKAKPPPLANAETLSGLIGAPKDGTAALPIVGIGASAGGLEALELFFRVCPADTGMGFILAPHLDSGHKSLLTEALQRSTSMPVVQALNQVAVEPNHLYVIPPNREMAILNGVLQLSRD